MSLSFDDKESFMEAAGSLRFNNPQSDSNTMAHQRLESQEKSDSESIGFNNPSNDMNTLQRMEKSNSQDLGEE